VNKHLEQVFVKLGVENRASARGPGAVRAPSLAKGQLSASVRLQPCRGSLYRPKLGIILRSCKLQRPRSTTAGK